MINLNKGTFLVDPKSIQVVTFYSDLEIPCSAMCITIIVLDREYELYYKWDDRIEFLEDCKKLTEETK